MSSGFHWAFLDERVNGYPLPVGQQQSIRVYLMPPLDADQQCAGCQAECPVTLQCLNRLSACRAVGVAELAGSGSFAVHVVEPEIVRLLLEIGITVFRLLSASDEEPVTRYIRHLLSRQNCSATMIGMNAPKRHCRNTNESTSAPAALLPFTLAM